MLLLLSALIALAVSASDRWPRSMRTLTVDVSGLSPEQAQLSVFEEALSSTHEAITSFYNDVVVKHEYVTPVYAEIIANCNRVAFINPFARAFAAKTGLDKCSYLVYRTFLEFAVDPLANVVDSGSEVFISYSEAVRATIPKGSDIYNFIQSTLFTLEVVDNGQKVATAAYIAGTNCIPFAMNHRSKTGVVRVHDNQTTREKVVAFDMKRGILNDAEKFPTVLKESISEFLSSGLMIASSRIAEYVFHRDTQDPKEFFIRNNNIHYAVPTMFLFSKDVNGVRSGEIYGSADAANHIPAYERTFADDWKLVQASDRRYDVFYGNDNRIMSVERKLEETSDNRTLENLYNTLRTYPARTNITSYVIAASLTSSFAFMQKCSNIKDSAGVAACIDPIVPFADLWYIFFVSLLLTGLVIAFWVLGAKYNKAYNRQRQSIIDADSVDDAAELVIEDEASEEKSNELELHD